MFGKRKGDGIPLLVYGRNGKKEVEGWWERWKGEVRVGSEVKVFHLGIKKIMDTSPSVWFNQSEQRINPRGGGYVSGQILHNYATK